MSDVGPVLIAIAVVVAILAAVLMSTRAVGPEERIVIYRLGNTDQSMVRGPGRAFLIPFFDRGILVDLREQRFEFGQIPATTGDGHEMSVDVSIRLRVDDPLKHVVNLISLSASLPGFIGSVVAEQAAALTLDDVRGGRLEAGVRDRATDVLEHWGVRLEQLDIAASGTS